MVNPAATLTSMPPGIPRCVCRILIPTFSSSPKVPSRYSASYIELSCIVPWERPEYTAPCNGRQSVARFFYSSNF